MPLPPALAARLAKRGIISQKSAQQQSAPRSQQEEEVFAENYDDQDHLKPNVKSSLKSMSNAEILEKIKFMGYPSCPNKWNVYHECSLFCQNHWNLKSRHFEPDSEYGIKHKAMMVKYGPLPEDWQEKWDPGTGRHFYWCTRTDKVSWLPPGHPKAKITEAASHVREMIQNQIHMEPDRHNDSDEDDEDEEAMDLDSDMESDHEEEEKRKREKEDKKKDKRKRESRVVDPMDPSSYSDVPRGTWSSGLEREEGTNNAGD